MLQPSRLIDNKINKLIDESIMSVIVQCCHYKATLLRMYTKDITRYDFIMRRNRMKS